MLALAAAAFGMFVALVADVLASRAGASRMASYGTSLGTGFSATLGLPLLLLSCASLATMSIAILAFGAWWFVFLNLAQALESSLRVRLLGEVRAAGGRLSRSALEARYSDASLLRLRLDRLRTHGAVVERDERLHVTSSGLKILAGFFRSLKKVLIGRTSEFGAPPE
jgi:hypothetical protein